MLIWVDNARIVAILAVIVLHVSGQVFDRYEIGSLYWWYGNIFDSFVRWCVPVFVMVSGALLLDPSKVGEGYFSFYRKRISKILLPLLLWSVFYLVWHYAKANYLPSVLEVVKLLLKGPAYYHLWFLYMMIGLYVFTPFMRRFVSAVTDTDLILFVAFGFVIAGVNKLVLFLRPPTFDLLINWFFYYIPFFFMGYLIRRSKYNPSNDVLLGTFGISVLFTALGVYWFGKTFDLSRSAYFYDYLSITVIPMSISILFLLKKWNSPILNAKISKSLSSMTLGIYCVHVVVLETVNRLFQVNTVPYNPLISIPAVTLLVFMLSLLITWLLAQLPVRPARAEYQQV